MTVPSLSALRMYAKGGSGGTPATLCVVEDEDSDVSAMAGSEWQVSMGAHQGHVNVRQRFRPDIAGTRSLRSVKAVLTYCVEG